MKIRTLDGPRLHRDFTAGARNIQARQEVLNSMNVFPVHSGIGSVAECILME
ncbi:MAG: hypothetical protein Q7I97_03285 [Thermovirgaceae bacterium]|nr:hypothetical protein [Thermovirgaceae bacterium]